MIEVKDIAYRYTDSNELRFPDFAMKANGRCLLLGESGSGKTTLLHLVGGLLRSQKGVIRINGTDIAHLGESALDRFRGKHIGFVFQRNHLISALTVKKNLLMAPFLAGVRQEDERVGELLSKLGLAEKMNVPVASLSHGQAQRVAIARAVINQPDIILADEPTSALDDKNCERVIEVLMTIAVENRAALLVATHDQRLKSMIEDQIRL